MRPSCFEVFLALSFTIPAFMAVMIVLVGGWRPGSPMWQPLLLCIGGTGVLLMLFAALLLVYARRR